MPGIREQFSSKGPAISRAIPALAAIERNPALAPAFGGAYGPEQRGFGQSDSPRTVFNPYRMRVSRSATLSVADGSTTVLTYDSIDDPNGNFSGSSTYTIPIDGRYQINLTAQAAPPVVTNNVQYIYVSLYLNGVQYDVGPPSYLTTIGTSFNPILGASLQDTLPPGNNAFHKGDQLTTRVTVATLLGTPGNWTIQGAQLYTFWSMILIGTQ